MWIAAKEKVKRKTKISEQKQVVFYWRSRLSNIRAYRVTRTRNSSIL
jgi:hypothetical protein